MLGVSSSFTAENPRRNFGDCCSGWTWLVLPCGAWILEPSRSGSGKQRIDLDEAVGPVPAFATRYREIAGGDVRDALAPAESSDGS